MMITFYFGDTKDMPMYEQLYKYLKEAIENNELHADEKLPSKRKLAAHLKISQTTIETAYMQLLAEGYIRSVPKVGYFVLSHLVFPKKRKVKETIKKKEVVTYAYDFKTNMVDADDFPYQKYAKIEREIILDKLSKSINKMDYFGLYSFREKIADILFAYRGIEAAPEQIVIGSGSEHLISLLVLLLGRDKLILTEDPSYIKNYLLYKEYGARVDVCDLDDQGMSIDQLKSLSADVIHITPAHQYPTGIITPISRRIELLDWVNENDHRYIVEDDYDSEFRFTGNPIPALKVLDEFDKVIYMNSFSKSISPSIRVSFMVLPRKLVKRYQESFSYFSCSVPITTQLALQAFIESNEFEKHLNRMKNIYKNKRDTLIKFLNLHFGHRISIKGSDAGLHFLVEIKTDLKEDQLIELAKKQSIRVYGLGEYYIKRIKRYPYPILIFGYSHLKLEDIENACVYLRQAWKEI
ncbi:PLP-dependent aminotransferase family protein [Hujiaoplasma nucleasis]|uniref:PLP-dependent aminotransferase family protein n=1 Tax=Hujiaoplasma nucleasis TaxID=2725268 RepID=A0A7L6N3V3_9MOLU|nr:PLP-dependent aminotransferase family protein [Hujiaoplasma nucleasis]QLY39917.1 PLP-dependent aminotransferase family protein [Hujiaoplasma nucleasis]